MDTNVNSERENLINSLINDGYLKTPAIIEAFKAIDRQDFVLDENKSDSYVNEPLSIGFGQTISQPLTVAFMLELLESKAGDKILDVGCGSGWQTALLAQIAGESGKVIGIERIPELKLLAEANIAKYGFFSKSLVKIILGDGSKGYKKEAHYDKIIVAAAAKEDVPSEWKKQLKIGGRIVAPVENSIIVIDKVGKNEYSQKEYFGFSFVPLITNSK